MSEEQFNQLSNKLSLLAALYLLPSSGDLNVSERVEILSRFGLPNGEIALIAGTSKKTVEVLKVKIKKGKK